MKNEHGSRLVQRYLSARQEGKDPYLDADDILYLLDYFEKSNDTKLYNEVLRLGLRLHPDCPELQIEESRELIFDGQYEKALEKLNAIAPLQDLEADILRIEAYCSLNQYSKAHTLTKMWVKDQLEASEEIFEQTAIMLNDLEMPDKAREFVEWGLSLFPNNITLKSELCYILEMENDIPKAIRLYEEIIDSNPYSAEPWFNLGRLYSMVDNYEKAIEALDFAATCEEPDLELLIFKGYCLFMNGSYEKAIEEYEEILRLYEGDEDVHSHVGAFMAECYTRLGDYEKAYQIYTTIINEPDIQNEAINFIHYIRCCQETGRDKEISHILLKATLIHPNNVHILSMLALNLADNGHKEEAASVLDKVFALMSQEDIGMDADADMRRKRNNLLRLGNYKQAKGETEQAIAYYNEALDLDPKTPMVHIHLALAYAANGDSKHCEEHLRQISVRDLAQYVHKTGKTAFGLGNNPEEHIPPENLAQAFLRNKDNSN